MGFQAKTDSLILCVVAAVVVVVVAVIVDYVCSAPYSQIDLYYFVRMCVCVIFMRNCICYLTHSRRNIGALRW